MRVSILIPVYNEALTLPLVIQRVLAAALPEGCEKEIVIINDGSTDGTKELADQFQGTPLVVVHHSPVKVAARPPPPWGRVFPACEYARRMTVPSSRPALRVHH